jgi:hypothetical protein
MDAPLGTDPVIVWKLIRLFESASSDPAVLFLLVDPDYRHVIVPSSLFPYEASEPIRIDSSGGINIRISIFCCGSMVGWYL